MAKRFPRKRRTQAPLEVASTFTGFPVALHGLFCTWRAWLPQALLIIGASLWIYWPALHGGLIWDDQWYVLMNPSLHILSGLWKIWYQPGNWVEYYPLHETVLWLQWHLWGDDTLGYHLTNLFLHIANALLVWRLFARLGLGQAWLGGLIFAVHPVQVESVAYIVELKNTLSLLFFLLAMIAWIDYEENQTKNDYQNALGLYFLGMLCKISAAPFAALILLYAWWKRGRIGWHDVKGCLPFLLLALLLTSVSIWAGRAYESSNHDLIGGVPLGGILSHIDAAGLNLAVYFARCFLPVDVLYIYPQWSLHPHNPLQYLPWLVFFAVICVLGRKRKSWGRHVLLGLGFFLLFIFPFLGFNAVSYMDFIWVMDHLLYIPIIGLIGLFVAGLGDLETKLPSWRLLFIGITIIGIMTMAWISHSFAKLFINEETFWRHVLSRNPTVWLARDNLGCNLMEQERYEEATVQERDAISLRPQTWDSYYNLGFALEKLGRTAEGEAAYKSALTLNPENPKIYLNLGELNRRLGNIAQAEALFTKASKIAPDDVSISADLAGIFEQSGRVPQAIALYEQAVKLNPDIAQLQYNLGAALLQTGNVSEAADHLDAALALDPKLPAAAHENLGAALAQLGRLPEAIEQFKAALQLNPSYAAARDNLGLALAQTGQVTEAIEQFRQALQAYPNDEKARQSLNKLQQYEIQQAPAK